MVRPSGPASGRAALGLGGRAAKTKAAEAMNPTTVPANSQWKLTNSSRAAARLGLIRLSRS